VSAKGKDRCNVGLGWSMADGLIGCGRGERGSGGKKKERQGFRVALRPGVTKFRCS